MSEGVRLIGVERQRQITQEGWSQERDNETHKTGEMALAAACYAIHHYSSQADIRAYYYNWAVGHWPWSKDWWKPTPDDPIKQLVKAGALIAAEIDRLVAEEAKLPNSIVLYRDGRMVFEWVANPVGREWHHGNSPIPFELVADPTNSTCRGRVRRTYYVMAMGEDGILRAVER